MAAIEAGQFDPEGYYAFNMTRGEVHTRSGDRVLVLSGDAVGPLISTAVKHGDLTAVRALGRKVGEQALDSLGSGAMDASPEAVATHAGGVLAMLGWGRLHLERWGKALVVRVTGAPELDGPHLGMAALLGGMLSALGGRDIACVPVGNEGQFLVVAPSVAEQVWAWAKESPQIGAVVARLAPKAEAAG